MNDNIYTIPLSEVFEPKCSCPLCLLEQKLEQRCVEYIMGAAMMEPDVRIETNKKGFCKEHFDMMLSVRNRLSLNLMLESHLMLLQSDVADPKVSKKSKIKQLEELSSSCYVCDKINWAMERMVANIVKTYQSDSTFADLFKSQPMLCQKHYLALLKASDKMPKKVCDDFDNTIDTIYRKTLDSALCDVSDFCKSFDYRNANSGPLPENVKNSAQTAIDFLTGNIKPQ
ncbi:MAG: hypothetical protein IKV58_02400 [Oscillospiraceae bacterium]|nr:hypothetical protein [Oscillospiraceae bacterium]